MDSIVLGTGLLILALEGLTCLFRFGFKIRAAEKARLYARLTRGVRIHHGYVGVGVVLTGILLSPTGPWQAPVLIVGFALLVSDLLHHFVVLPVCLGCFD